MDILQALRGIFEEIMPYVDSEKINYSTRLREDLGLTDIALTAAAMTVEERFGFSFPRDSGIETVGEIAEYIERYENINLMDNEDFPEEE